MLHGGQVNYTEKYLLLEKDSILGFFILDEYEREHQAVEAMEQVSTGKSGAWRVVRITEVIVASVAKS
jgi:hypothetical protein